MKIKPAGAAAILACGLIASGMWCLAGAAAQTRSGRQVVSPNHSEATATAYHNMKVNQDRNPHPKKVIGVAVNPADPNNVVVLTAIRYLGIAQPDGYREVGAVSFHVTTDGGQHWIDDLTPKGTVSGEGTPRDESPVAISFSRPGHTYMAMQALAEERLEDASVAEVAVGLQTAPTSRTCSVKLKGVAFPISDWCAPK